MSRSTDRELVHIPTYYKRDAVFVVVASLGAYRWCKLKGVDGQFQTCHRDELTPLTAEELEAVRMQEMLERQTRKQFR